MLLFLWLVISQIKALLLAEFISLGVVISWFLVFKQIDIGQSTPSFDNEDQLLGFGKGKGIGNSDALGFGVINAENRCRSNELEGLIWQFGLRSCKKRWKVRLGSIKGPWCVLNIIRVHPLGVHHGNYTSQIKPLMFCYEIVNRRCLVILGETIAIVISYL